MGTIPSPYPCMLHGRFWLLLILAAASHRRLLMGFVPSSAMFDSSTVGAFPRLPPTKLPHPTLALALACQRNLTYCAQVKSHPEPGEGPGTPLASTPDGTPQALTPPSSLSHFGHHCAPSTTPTAPEAFGGTPGLRSQDMKGDMSLCTPQEGLEGCGPDLTPLPFPTHLFGDTSQDQTR